MSVTVRAGKRKSVYGLYGVVIPGIIVLMLVTGFSISAYKSAKEQLFTDIDKELKHGATALKMIIGENYLQKARNAEVVDSAEYFNLTEKISFCASQCNYYRVYSLVESGEGFRYTAYGLPKRKESGASAVDFFQKYTGKIKNKYDFADGKPIYFNSTNDKDEQIRTVLLPFETSGGVITATAIELNMSNTQELLKDELNRILLTGGFSVLLVIPVFLWLGFSNYERRNAIRKMLESEERYRTTLHSVGDAVISTDIQGRVTAMNIVAEHLTGYNQSEASGQKLEDIFVIVNAFSKEKVANPVDKVIATGHIVGLANHTVLIAKDGSEIQIADSAAPIFDDKENMAGIVLVFRDITEEYRVRRELEKSEERFRKTFYISPDAVNINRMKDGMYVDINHGFTSITGFTREDVSGKTSAEIDIWTDISDRQKLVDGLRENGVYQNLEADFRKKDGSVITGLMSASIIYIEDEPHILSITRDISAVKEAQKKESENRRIIEEERLLFQKLAETSPVSIVKINTSGQITYANSKAETVLELSKENIEQTHFDSPDWKNTDLAGNELAPDELPVGIVMKTKEAVYNFEHCAEVSTGKKKVLSVNAAPLFDSSGDLEAVIAVFDDITENHAVREAREADKAFMESVLKSIPVPVFFKDTEGRYIGCNDKFTEVMGVSSEEIEGKTVYELWPGEHAEKYHEKDIELINNPEYQMYEFEVIDKKGETVPVIYAKTVFTDLSGNIAGIIGSFFDISERKQAEDALKLSEEQYRALFENATIGIYRTTPEGKVLAANPSLISMLGYNSLEEIKSRDLSQTGYKNIDTRKEFLSNIEKEGNLKGFESEWLKKDGTVIHIRESATVYRDSESNILYFEGMVEDITDRKRAEEALEKRLIALTRPLGNAEEIEFEELFNLEDIQKIQDDFAESANVASLITRPDGSPITKPTNFCRLCNEIIRETPKGRLNCYKSDAKIGAPGKDEPLVMPCFSGGLWDAGAAITVGGKHVASWLVGQVRDESQSEETIRKYAKEIGADEEEAVKAFNEVPEMSYERFKKVAEAVYTLAAQLSDQAYQNIQQARFIAEKREHEEEILTLNKDLTIKNEELTTAKEEAERNAERLSEKQAVIDSVINNIPFDIWARDKNEICFLQNTASTKLWGNLLDNTPDQQNISEETRNIWKTNNRRVLSGETLNKEIEFVDSFGNLRYMQNIIAPIYLEGKIFGMVGINIDISERKEYEDNLKQAKEKAEESNMLKTTFLANLSHEIRTPMNGILGFAELMKKPNLTDEKQTKYLGAIEQSGNRMLALINDLVDISKIEAGQVVLHSEEVHLNTLTDNLFVFFNQEAEKKGLELSYSKGLPDFASLISVDRTKLEQVWSNLIKNALKFTAKGKVDFGYVQKTDFLEFRVTDTGRGIAKELQKDVFDRFRQAEASPYREEEGSGLGLAISKAYVEMMGGEISVESEIGNGSEFIFTIPYTPLGKPKTKKTADNVNFTNTDISVLIAEDDNISFVFLQEVLESKNIKLTRVTSGLDAVEFFKEGGRCDIVLMDIKMPKMNGYEAARIIMNDYPGIPIVALTAYANQGDKEKALEKGFSGYITKPVYENELIELIVKVLNK